MSESRQALFFKKNYYFNYQPVRDIIVCRKTININLSKFYMARKIMQHFILSIKKHKFLILRWLKIVNWKDC